MKYDSINAKKHVTCTRTAMWHTSALGLFVCRDFYLKTSVQHVMLYSPPLRCEWAPIACPHAGTLKVPRVRARSHFVNEIVAQMAK